MSQPHLIPDHFSLNGGVVVKKTPTVHYNKNPKKIDPAEQRFAWNDKETLLYFFSF